MATVLTRDEVDALWERWYRDPDPDRPRLREYEIVDLFATIWALLDSEARDRSAVAGAGDD
jgi:hypothetical protein